MSRPTESWVRAAFRSKIRKLSPTDRQGDTIVWKQEDKLDDNGKLLGVTTIHTYVSEFIALATDIIEDEAGHPTDADVHASLKTEGLEPDDAASTP